MSESKVCLLRNIHNVEDGVDGEVYFKLFNQYIKLYSWKGAGMNYIEKCANYLNSFSDEVINRLCEASIRYCNDFCDMVGEEPKEWSYM